MRVSEWVGVSVCECEGVCGGGEWGGVGGCGSVWGSGGGGVRVRECGSVSIWYTICMIHTHTHMFVTIINEKVGFTGSKGKGEII